MRAAARVQVLLLASLLSLPMFAWAEAIPVELRQSENGWQLLRGGVPYFIRGAGGDASLEALAAAGANSVRTWDADNIGARLDQAHALGLSVTVGIWLGHERHGFDYSDKNQVAEQLERARQAVLRYKDYPAVLLWGIGNEMEGFGSGDNPEIWAAVNEIAAMVKRIDPAHPTMTVTAEIAGGRIAGVHKHSPAVDIHGINSYGGAPSLLERYRAAGATKPYVLTEFGPAGEWEAPKTAWGAPIEPTSSEKAMRYRIAYEQAVTNAQGVALGSYAFTWGSKMEATATWFGMFVDDGGRLAAVDTMTELWTGSPPGNLAPTVQPLALEGPGQLKPGQELGIHAAVADPEGGPVSVRWVLRPEPREYATGGDFRPGLPEIESAVIESRADSARVRMPLEPGPYRLFLYVRDTAGNAATANVPLLVKGQVRTRLPLVLYEDGFDGMPWVPSGWMGSYEFLTLDGNHTNDPHTGKACIKLRYVGELGWVGVAWQNPVNNWGDKEGGYDLSGAEQLEVWARGEYGGEEVSFGIGLLGSDTAHPDSGKTSIDDIVLTREWRRYLIPLKRVDLSSIKTGFVIGVTGRQTPVTVYLDSIRFIR